jgi:hypothetical protein
MNTRSLKMVVVLAMVLAIAVVGVSALAQGKMGMEGKAKAVVVRGEIVDLACYLDHGAMGMKHQQCALTCLKNGEPMGLLTADGKVYLLLADHQDGKPFAEAKTYAALQVEVSGPVAEKAGITALTVEKVNKL